MKKLIYLAAALWLSGTLSAQLRPTDKTGINVFETPKTHVEFTAPHVSFGASIAMPYIALKQSNNVVANVASTTDATKTIANPQTLFKNSSNFALSQANLYINSYLADGVTLNLTLYLASKHHNETWVKGGYVQFDKVPFLKLDLLDKIMQYTTVKLGQMEVNYGDAHFRRSDGGNAIYNPFMENYIMDEFATEIGAEADVNYNGIVGVAAITNGNLNPSLAYIDTTQATYKYSNGLHNPSWILKLGYDKQFTDKFRARLTGSVYTTAGSLSNTLFGGDRTGSNYSAVMYNAAPGTSTAFNGRYNPGLSDKLTTFMGNLFLRYKPMDMLVVESFTTIESAKGRTAAEKNERTANQFATDVVLRFGHNENFFAGARYNTLSADVAASAKVTTVSGAYTYVTQDAWPAYTIKINRIAISGGWFMTKNIMAKVEWVKQKYTDVPNVNYIFNGAQFQGLTAEAIISF
ncbi:hypothetical protein [Paludibacter sp.]|uniref:hypothetical protein n=1 Tax=Paludibacter sp. TaxID=1898105 RepID=UPI001352325B|nr:hypothetical protein [Paludibacter sp.]MTK51931.1 hypothetical protein [Paludibacter sp.]